MRRVSLRCICSAIGTCLLGILLIFAVSNFSTNSRQTKSELFNCDCPSVKKSDTEAKTVVGLNASTVTTTPNVFVFKPCEEVQKTSPVQRAILIYYPDHQKSDFFSEVRWLYRSWAEMLIDQPATWRTDFVIFSYNFSEEFRSLGCVNYLRQNKQEPSMCRLFLYVPIQFRTSEVIKQNYQFAFDNAKKIMESYTDITHPLTTVPLVTDKETFDATRSQSLYDNLRTYGYVDSINTIYEGYWTFNMYDFILRTDIDVFIYRHFANYIPTNCSFITGGGGYGTHFNRRKLGRIARDMGLAHANISGMGSTWYGSPRDAFVVANYTLDAMLWLAQYEFAMPERESKLGTMMWPEWHYGVLLLYGQHIALNHLVAVNAIKIILGTNLLDQSSTDNTVEYIQKGTRLNLHCWHTNERFSKFAFKMGHYNQTDLEKYRNDTTAQAYAMRMALESKYMTLEQLASHVQQAQSLL